MIYLFTAIYPEAKPLIQRFQLKKEDNANPFDTFYNEEIGIRLVLTGVGSISAATAVGNICSYYPVSEEDFLINFGSCAGKEIGEIFLGNKLVESATGRTFYPDILWKHPFREKEIVTESVILDRGLVQEEVLYDMEAAAIYQAASFFVSPHQMYFIKVVSDKGEGAEVKVQPLQSLLEQHMDTMEDFLKELQEISDIEKAKGQVFCDGEQEMIQRFCVDLHCSKTMEAAVWQCARYGKLSGIAYEAVIDQMYRKELLPCKDKREGKVYFEEFRKQIL